MSGRRPAPGERPAIGGGMGKKRSAAAAGAALLGAGLALVLGYVSI
jgi:hypothetical protein